MNTPKPTASGKSGRRTSGKAVAKQLSQNLELQSPSEEKPQGDTFKQTIYPYITTGKHIAALSRQRRREKESELYRDAVDIGSLFLSIEGEPAPNGFYGTLSVEDLAKRLRPKVIIALDWLAQHGHPVQTGSSLNGLEALFGLLQQGMIPSALKPAPEPEPARMTAAVLEEFSDVILSEQLEITLSVDDGDGFL